MKKLIITSVAMLMLSGCATWSAGEATKDGKPVEIAVSSENQPAPETIKLIEGDIQDKKYKVLAELIVVVNKTTIFNADPTPEMAGKKLQEEAALLGADAVIQVRYGSTGVSFMSWGSLEGKGRAIKFE